ncbi:MAG: hypothetical protein ACRC7P_05315, partial [Enterovibrio sp.]
ATSAILLSNTVLEREYLLQISGITAAAEIFKLESSLKQMGSVASAQLRSIQKDEVSFTVKLASSQSQFTTELALNTDLLAVIDEEPETTFAVESEAEKTLPLTGDAQANLSLSQVEQELAAMTMPQVSAAQATASSSFDLLAPAPNTGAAAAVTQGVPLTPVDGAVSSASAAAPAAAQNAPEAPPAPTVLRYMWRP